MIYKSGVVGEVTFVDEDFHTIQLPFNPPMFGHIHNTDGTVKGYVLRKPDYEEEVLMLTDGTVPLDGDGHYICPVNWGEDGAWYPSLGSTVITCSPGDSQGAWTWRYGLYDMEARRQILPNAYDRIEIVSESLYTVMQGGQSWLYDDRGGLLYTFDPSEGTIVYNYSWLDWPGYEFYYLNQEHRIFFKQTDFSRHIYYEWMRWGDSFLVVNFDGSDNALTVYDQDGQPLYRNRCDYQYQLIGSDFVFRNRETYVVLDRNLRERHFPAAFGSEYTQVLGYRDGALHIEYGGSETTPEQTFAALYEDGSIRNIHFADAGQPPILYRYPDHYLFVGNNNEILAETDGYISICGDFVIVKERFDDDGRFTMRTDPKAVYALDGRLLLENVYGCIDEGLGPGGGMFVYLDETTCVLLSADGATLPVPAAQAVERQYWGG